MRHYSKFRAIFASLYSSDLYRDIRVRWDGLGITYLFMLHVVLITPAIIMLVLLLERTLFAEHNGTTLARTLTEEVINQMPTLHWENGDLSVAEGEEPRLIHITYEGTRIPFMRIALDSNIMEVGSEKEFMLLTRGGIHFRKSGSEIESRRWTDIITKPTTLTQADMQELADKGLGWLDQNRAVLYVTFGVFIWALTILAMFIYRMFIALIYGGVGVVLCHLMKTRIEYYTLVRLATVALTPSILINLGLSMVIGSGISYFMSIMVNTGYMAFAIHANRMLTPQT